MLRTIESIECNGCQVVGMREVGTDSKKRLRPHEMRNLLSCHGWRVSQPGGKDYCRTCVAAGRHREDDQ
jgi:hypothetical protein